MQQLPVVILISGNGSNLQAIIDNCSGHIDIRAVISDQGDAYGLTRADNAGIKTLLCPQWDDESREEYSAGLAEVVEQYRPELVIMAGFMKILTKEFTNKFDRIVNIHPSLLPLHKGLHTHQRVIKAGDKEHGMTIHWVTEELDSGPIIWQQSFPVSPEDTAEILEEKVHKLEHEWYPWAIKEIACGTI